MSYLHNNKVVILPESRDEFTIKLRDNNKYIKSLKECERNLAKLNIPFNELYTRKSNQNVSDTLSDSLNIVIDPELFDSIKHHIINIENFSKKELSEQKTHIHMKMINRLIDCDNETKEELYASLASNKEILCALHSIISDMEKILKSYDIMKDKNKQFIIENDILEKDLQTETQREAKLKNNISYYKVHIRKIKMLFDQIRHKKELSPINISSNQNDLQHNYSYRNNHNCYIKTSNGRYLQNLKLLNCKNRNINNIQYQSKTEQETTVTYYNKSNLKHSSSVMNNTVLGNNMLPTNVTNSNKEISFNIQSERRKQRYKNMYNKISLLYKEKNKLFTKENENQLHHSGLLFNKILEYIELAKIKYLKNNKRFVLIYKKNDLFNSNQKILNDEGFRKLFLELLIKDVDIQTIVDKNIMTAVTHTTFMLNKNKQFNKSVYINSMRSFSN